MVPYVSEVEVVHQDQALAFLTYDDEHHRFALYWPIHHGKTLSLYDRDPDGNRMEFQVDHGTVEEAAAFMASPGIAADPIGVAYDPDTLLTRYEAGAFEADPMTMPTGEPASLPAEHDFA